jgi:hypothetical protein
MWEGLSVRKAIEEQPVVVREREYRLQVVGIAEHADGGAGLTILVPGSSSQYLQLDVPESIVRDPIALRQQVVCAVNQILTAR